MITDNDQDIFICGKCRTNFSDLTTFLKHRTTCDGQQPQESSCPFGDIHSDVPSPQSSSLVQELDAIVQDVSLTTSELFFQPNNLPISNVSSSPDFDLLFAPPIKQDVVDNELLSPNVSDFLQLNNNISEKDAIFESNISKAILLECPVCDEQFEAPAILENHIFEHSTWIDEDEEEIPSTKMSGCSFDDSTSSYNDLSDDSPSTTTLRCKQCTITFTSNASLCFHKKMIHCLNPVFRCLNDTCAQLFDRPVDYILHARVHSQKRHYGVRRSGRFGNIHRRRKRTHRCSICKKLFPSIESLQHHTRYETHTFDCQLCPAVFDSNNSYHNHIAQHGEIRLYRCTVCIESFQKRTDLSRHVLTKHNEDLPKQKSCLSCKLTFKTSFHLNRHNVTKHSDIKPFKCEENGCEQAFARKDKLKQHAAKHDINGGMYKCQICVKTFVRPEHLRDHDIVRHSRQYPFRCEYCRKGFLHQNQLYAHHKQRHPAEQHQLILEDDKSYFSFNQIVDPSTLMVTSELDDDPSSLFA